MIIASSVLGFIAGAITGFRSGLGQWKLFGLLGVLIELIVGITLLNIYPVLNFEFQMVLTVAVGGFMLGNAIAAPAGAIFNS
jgi:hypothetical protein